MARDGGFIARAYIALISVLLFLTVLLFVRTFVYLDKALDDDQYLSALGYIACLLGLTVLLGTLIPKLMIMCLGLQEARRVRDRVRDGVREWFVRRMRSVAWLFNIGIALLGRVLAGPPPIFDEHAHNFVEALFDKDDATALSLLEDGRVTIHSPLTRGPGGPCCDPGSSCCGERSMLNAALIAGREKVARVLLRRGADINTFRDFKRPGSSVSVAGYAISCGDIRTLALSRKLGANMDFVLKDPMDGPGSTLSSLSGVSFAIMVVAPDCLEYLLEKVYLERPIVLTQSDRYSLCLNATIGPPAMRLFKVLRARGYDFSILKTDEDELVQDGAESCRVTYADILVTCARDSGDASFMRYVVKRLGMASAAGKVAATQDFVDLHTMLSGIYKHKAGNSRASGRDDCAPHVDSDFRDEEFTKYECAACKSVCATMWRTVCGKVRYCSKACGMKHWKTGGHKKECKKLQRPAAQAD